MKIFYLLFLLPWLTLCALEKQPLEDKIIAFPLKINQLYNETLTDQTSIEKFNQQRPKIYIYTDFGFGKNKENPVVDLQTCMEIASAGWKSTLQQDIYVNDSAIPLSPFSAAITLASTFPYQDGQEYENEKIHIHTIVVHIVDPGVGNESNHPQPRSIALRKDGVLFIGPDNGSLTLVCPDKSIAGIWEIDPARLNLLSGIDVDAGGTFHGRDLFCESAFRIASGTISLNEIGTPYLTLAIKTKISSLADYHQSYDLEPIEFAIVQTERVVWPQRITDANELFSLSFLLGMIQSPLYENKTAIALTHSKKLFILAPALKTLETLIAIVNEKTGNIYIGPNNGLGTSFFKDYPKKDIAAFNISPHLLETIKNESNNEIAYLMIKQQPPFNGHLKELDYLETNLKRDSKGRPQKLQARIWIDAYGNIKTTAQSPILNEAKKENASVKVQLN